MVGSLWYVLSICIKHIINNVLIKISPMIISDWNVRNISDTLIISIRTQTKVKWCDIFAWTVTTKWWQWYTSVHQSEDREVHLGIGISILAHMLGYAVWYWNKHISTHARLRSVGRLLYMTQANINLIVTHSYCTWSRQRRAAFRHCSRTA